MAGAGLSVVGGDGHVRLALLQGGDPAIRVHGGDLRVGGGEGHRARRALAQGVAQRIGILCADGEPLRSGLNALGRGLDFDACALLLAVEGGDGDGGDTGLYGGQQALGGHGGRFARAGEGGLARAAAGELVAQLHRLAHAQHLPVAVDAHACRSLLDRHLDHAARAGGGSNGDGGAARRLGGHHALRAHRRDARGLAGVAHAVLRALGQQRPVRDGRLFLDAQRQALRSGNDGLGQNRRNFGRGCHEDLRHRVVNLYRGQEAVLFDRRGRRGQLRQQSVDLFFQGFNRRAGVVELQRVGLGIHGGGQQRPQRLQAVIGQITLAAHIVVGRRARAGGELRIRQAVVPRHRGVGQRKVPAEAALAVVHERVDVRPFAVEQGHVPRAVLRRNDPTFQPGGSHQRLEGLRVARRIRAAHHEGRVGRAVRAGGHVGHEPVVEPERAGVIPAQALAVQGGDPLKYGLLQLRRLLGHEGILCGRFAIALRRRVRGRFAAALRGRVCGRFAAALRGRVCGCFAAALHGSVRGRFAAALRGRVCGCFAAALRGSVRRRFATALRGRFRGSSAGLCRAGFRRRFRRRLNLDACLRAGCCGRCDLRGLVCKRGRAAQQQRQAEQRGQYAQLHLVFHSILYLRIVA